MAANDVDTETLTLQDLTGEALVALSRQSDPVGVLSVYLDADPQGDPALRGVAIDIHNRLAELRRRIEAGEAPERVRALLEGIRRAEGEVERLAATPPPGRGRAVFIGLGSGEVTRFASQLPLPNRVVLDRGAFIHPLLELMDEARPAGVVVASREEARLMEWRGGDLEELERLEPVVVEAPHERSGPVGSAPTPRQGTPQREQREARGRDRVARFLDQVAAAVERVAGERGWESVLLSGGERLTDRLAEALPAALRERAVRDQRLLSGHSQASLTATVVARLREAHATYEARLVGQARESNGAMGLSEVVAALNEARVAHLIYDPEVRYEGSVGSDGLMYAPGESGPAGSVLEAEPRLTERLVERALDTSARVSPVEGAAAGALAEADGIAALLRW